MSDERYRREIDRIISEKSGEIILNGSYDHAAVILERMFARANEIVRIVTKTLEPRVYCDIRTMESACKMLGDPRRKIEILVEDLDSVTLESNPYFREMSHFENLEIRTVPAELKTPLSVNFALMDDRGYRFEKDQSGTTAIVAFGEPTLTPRLKYVFDRVWSESQAVKTDLVPA